MEKKEIKKVEKQILSGEDDIKEIKHIEKMQLLESDNKYCGLNENDVFLTKKEKEVEEKKIIIYNIYSKEGKLIGQSDENGNIELTEEYKSKLQENYKEFYDKLGIDKRKVKISEIEKYVEKNDLEDKNKESSKSEKNGEDEKQEKLNEDDKTKEEGLNEEEKIKENEKVEKMEENLGLNPKDIKSSSEIKDIEFYKIVPEAKEYKGNVSIVYIGSTKEFKIVGVDRKTGQYKQLETVEASRATEVGETKRSIDIGRDGSEVEAKSLKAILNIKGDKEYSFAAKLEGINPIELKELRRDLHSGEYISADLETSNQYPINEKVAEMMNKNKNINVRDEVEKYNREEAEGREVTTIENIEDEKEYEEDEEEKQKTPWDHLKKYGY